VAWAIWIFGCVTVCLLWGHVVQHDVYSAYWCAADFGFGAVVLAWAFLGPWGLKAALDQIPPKLWRIGPRMNGIGEAAAVEHYALNPDNSQLSDAGTATSSIRQ
jgi:hypothetical protein